MKVNVNGHERQLPEGTTLAGLLAQAGVDVARVAIELNGKVVPRVQFAQAVLNDGDTLEIVTLVGGG